MGVLCNAKNSFQDNAEDNSSVIRKCKKQRPEKKMRGSISSDMQSSDASPTPSSVESALDSSSRSGQIVVTPEQQEEYQTDLETPATDPTTNNPALKKAIQQLLLETDCVIIQNKWHRKYGPPNSWNGMPPPRGTEVFVGKIPRDLFEDELIPVLQKAGNLYEVRLMMENSSTNRGFAYVKYASKAEADNAVCILNNYEIRQRHILGVMKSVDNNRLFIGGIPKNRRQDELLHEMNRLTDEVLDVILYSDVCDKSKNRGFAFVEYKNHTAASAARQKLLKNPPLLWGCNQVKVDWAEPEREVDEQTMMKVRVLYVRNLALATTEQNLKDLFCSLGGMVERVKKMKDYAFVHFVTREEAEKAKDAFQGHILDGCRIDICWSKPVANREEYQQRKAASKAMLSVAAVNATIPTPLGFTILSESDQMLSAGRVRTAAGAQGYSAPKPYPTRPRSENMLNSLQSSSMLMTNPYLSSMTMRSSVEQIGISAYSPVIYTTDRMGAEEIFNAQTELQCQYASPPPIQRYHQPWMPHPIMNVVPQIQTAWPSQPYIQHQMPPQAPGMVQYVIPQGSIVLDNQYGTYGCPQLFPGQIMAQIPSISGSNMSIDRT